MRGHKRLILCSRREPTPSKVAKEVRKVKVPVKVTMLTIRVTTTTLVGGSGPGKLPSSEIYSDVDARTRVVVRKD